jgi:hypothetical protein
LFNTVLFFTNVNNKTMAVTSAFWALIYCKTMAGIIAFCTILAHSIFIIWEWHGNLYSVLYSFYSHGYYLRMAWQFVFCSILILFSRLLFKDGMAICILFYAHSILTAII